MNRDVVLFGSRGEGERMPLPEGYLWAVEKDILTSTSDSLLLLDLDLAYSTRMLDDLGDVSLVSRPHFSKYSLPKED